MSWKVRISRQALEDLDRLRAYDPTLYRGAYELALSIERSPYLGLGSPARLPLIGPNTWYRRLSLLHRVVYEVSGEAVLIGAFMSHFE